MERGGQGQQTLTDQIKEEPGQQEPDEALSNPDEAHVPASFCERDAHKLLQTGRTKNPILVFGNAFSAIVLSAAWTPSDGFAPSVVEATLKTEVTHPIYAEPATPDGGGNLTSCAGESGTALV